MRTQIQTCNDSKLDFYKCCIADSTIYICRELKMFLGTPTIESFPSHFDEHTAFQRCKEKIEFKKCSKFLLDTIFLGVYII